MVRRVGALSAADRVETFDMKDAPRRLHFGAEFRQLICAADPRRAPPLLRASPLPLIRLRPKQTISTAPVTQNFGDIFPHRGRGENWACQTTACPSREKPRRAASDRVGFPHRGIIRRARLANCRALAVGNRLRHPGISSQREEIEPTAGVALAPTPKRNWLGAAPVQCWNLWLHSRREPRTTSNRCAISYNCASGSIRKLHLRGITSSLGSDSLRRPCGVVSSPKCGKIVACISSLWERIMSWTTPVIVEETCGMEVTSYASAAL
jgi:coenzyme PQQ precursor peptide PqqA